jgi:cytochrome c oxidase subunit 2
MPITVRVVSEQAFAAWVEDAKKKYASDDTAPPANVVAATQAAAR